MEWELSRPPPTLALLGLPFHKKHKYYLSPKLNLLKLNCKETVLMVILYHFRHLRQRRETNIEYQLHVIYSVVLSCYHVEALH